jgi:hypothetical protein
LFSLLCPWLNSCFCSFSCPWQLFYIWCIYIVTFFYIVTFLQVDNLNPIANLENYCFYAMLITCKCTPLCKKLDYDAKSEPPYLTTTLIPNRTCTRFIVHTMNLIHSFTYLYTLQVWSCRQRYGTIWMKGKHYNIVRLLHPLSHIQTLSYIQTIKYLWLNLTIYYLLPILLTTYYLGYIPTIYYLTYLLLITTSHTYHILLKLHTYYLLFSLPNKLISWPTFSKLIF